MNRVRLALLLVAGGLSTLAGCHVARLWRNLPAVRLRHLDSAAYDRALREASTTMSDDARQGLIAANISSLFTAALHEPTVYTANRDNVEQMITRLKRTQLGRVQVAALLMLELEQAGTPVDQWWPRIEPVLSGLGHATFAHLLPELISQRTQVFSSLGFASGTAHAQAEQLVGHPHGPLLEFFVERLERVAAARGAAGDGSAELCERLVRRLLRQWTLDPGPVGLRLLAADLLAQNLDRPPPESAPATPQLAQPLRAWRAAYRNEAAARPVPLALFSPRAAPELRPVAYNKLVNDLSRTIWVTAATFAAALLAVLALLVALPASLRSPTNARMLFAGIAVALLVAAAWFVWSEISPPAPLEDLRRFDSRDLGWPRQPLAAAGATLLLLALVLLWPGRGGIGWRGRLVRLADAAAAAWVVLAPTLIVAAALAVAALGSYEHSVGEAYEAGELVTIAGPQADRLLDGLRAWQP